MSLLGVRRAAALLLPWVLILSSTGGLRGSLVAGVHQPLAGNGNLNGPASVGGGLDCNGYSPISYNPYSHLICADPLPSFTDNGYYIGHDEPAIQFFSSNFVSGYNLQWEINLPLTDPVPTQTGTVIANFELYPALWFGLALCDPHSYPLNSCTPDSDSNLGSGSSAAGSAFLELQFYPPGDCFSTTWCAALNIFSLECNFNFVTCNPSCEEPFNYAFIQTDGVPTGPPGPGSQTSATFIPTSKTLSMNPGDTVRVTIRDTINGLENFVEDLTSGLSGFMFANAANGFKNTSSADCTTSSFSFHPEYNTAAAGNVVPWAALQPNVDLSFETGHFELGSNPDSDSDDTGCGMTNGITNCFGQDPNLDLDFDGVPYHPNWPDGSSNHPSPIIIGAPSGNGVGPLSYSGGVYSAAYNTIKFATTTTLSLPSSSPFYPFYSQAGAGSACRFNFGNDISGKTTNDFSKTSQYGTTVANPCIPVSNPLLVIHLQPGWNLISLPVVPTHSAITAVLASLIALNEVVVVWGYNAATRTWLSFVPHKSSTLTTMKDGNGYWIYMSTNDTLNVNGFVVPPASAPPAYPLATGWNLVGFKPQPDVQNETVSQYLSSIAGLYDADHLWVYDNLNDTWIQGASGMELAPSEAMWIYMNTPATLLP